MSAFGKIKILSYHPEHGKSYYRVKCECGRIVDVYCWSGSKKCDCGRILSLKYSPEGREISVTPRELGIPEQKRTKVTAPCMTCGKEIHFVEGIGWSHLGEKEFDHPALPVYNKIKRIEETT